MLPPPPQSTLFPYTTLFRSATGLAITSNEALRLVAREVRLHILVVVHRVAVTLEPGRGRGLHLFAALERQHRVALRSEEHTSELQSLTNLVCRLLLEKKKKQ